MPNEEKDDLKNLGYLEFDGKSYSYYFNDKNFRLTLVPPSAEDCDRLAFSMFENVNASVPNRSEWIRSRYVVGRKLTVDSHILFSILDSPSLNNGIMKYPVNWYLELPIGADVQRIDGIEVIGGEANLFYSPNHVLETNIKSQEIIVKGIMQDDVDCGTFSIDSNTECAVTASAFVTLHPYEPENSLSAASTLRLMFSNPLGLEKVLKVYGNVRGLFYFLGDRHNIIFDSVRLLWKSPINRSPNHMEYGKLHFPMRNIRKDVRKSRNKFITYEDIGTHTADLLSYIYEGKPAFEHTSDSENIRSSYPPERIIAICIEFERDFKNIYGMDAGRSDKYKTAKADAVKILTEAAQAPGSTGKRKDAFKGFAKILSNLDGAYGQRVRYAIDSNVDTVTPFIDEIYVGGLENQKDGIADRLNTLRDSLAHGNLDFELAPVNVADIEFLEILTYIIVLQQFVEPANVTKAINDLFGFHILVQAKC